MRFSPPKSPHRLWKEEVLSEILNYVADGVFAGIAAKAMGVAGTVWAEWLRWGRAGFEPYLGFLERLEKAEAKACVWHVQNLKRHAAGESIYILKNVRGDEIGVRSIGDWRPSTFWLARKYAMHWSEKQTGQNPPDEGLSTEQETRTVTIEWLAKVVSEMGYEMTEKKNGNQAASHPKCRAEGSPRATKPGPDKARHAPKAKPAHRNARNRSGNEVRRRPRKTGGGE